MKTNALMDECKVFWAFGNTQFKEALEKLNLPEGEKLLDIGAGGFMPASNKDRYISGMKQIAEEFDAQMKDEKTRKDYILYELHNHEAFYTGSIESTLDALGEDYTLEEVKEVYKSHARSECGCNK